MRACWRRKEAAELSRRRACRARSATATSRPRPGTISAGEGTPRLLRSRMAGREAGHFLPGRGLVHLDRGPRAGRIGRNVEHIQAEEGCGQQIRIQVAQERTLLAQLEQRIADDEVRKMPPSPATLRLDQVEGFVFDQMTTNNDPRRPLSNRAAGVERELASAVVCRGARRKRRRHRSHRAPSPHAADVASPSGRSSKSTTRTG